MLCKKTFNTLGATALLVFLLFNTSYADIINGDFSSGLDGWTGYGDVSAVTDTDTSNSYAVIGDNNYIWSYLYKPTNLEPTNYYTIEFDFANELSNVPYDDDPAFLDTFYASLYFINDISQFDLFFSFKDSLPLAEMDAYGVFNDFGGNIGPSSKGEGWQHYSISFYNEYDYVIPTFELIDWNWKNDDSHVFIDNVSINPVPEPATLFLLGPGLAGLGVFSRKRKKR
ncbi:MAG: PEP-CTERM sorting domain-containing protein [Deltaproteobacteria bacterium]|nr:PEP-CTERM sorting domain-containing protein [Deltaproteobacteria bacterium]